MIAAAMLVPGVRVSAGERLYTVEDDIRLTQFITPFIGENLSTVVRWSPDGRYLATVTERSLIADGVVEDTLWVFPASAIKQLLKAGTAADTSPGIELVKVRDVTSGLSNLSWLDDSSGLAFLARNGAGHHELRIADIATRKARAISLEAQEVTGFDIRNGRVVYAALMSGAAEPSDGPGRVRSDEVVVGTGRNLFDFIVPPTPPTGKSAYAE